MPSTSYHIAEDEAEAMDAMQHTENITALYKLAEPTVLLCSCFHSRLRVMRLILNIIFGGVIVVLAY